MARLGSFILLLLTLLGCTSAPTVRTAPGTATVEQILERVRTNIERIHAVSGAGSIAVESPEIAGSGSFEIVLQKPDSVLLRLEGPFGIRVGVALITRTTFLFYNSVENQVITGSTSSANLSRYVRMNVTFDDLLNLFAGSAVFSEDVEGAGELTTEENRYVLTYHRANRTRRYVIDPETLLITAIQHLDASGKLVAEQHYSQYRRVQDISFPTAIRFTLHAERRVLSIRYSAFRLNEPMLSFAIDIPENARRVQVQ
jgi:outer membrane lipoprotein-sorting protein